MCIFNLIGNEDYLKGLYFFTLDSVELRAMFWVNCSSFAWPNFLQHNYNPPIVWLLFFCYILVVSSNLVFIVNHFKSFGQQIKSILSISQW